VFLEKNPVLIRMFVDNLLVTGNSVAEIAAVHWQENMKSLDRSKRTTVLSGG
jgi:hypothetical protein